MQRQMLKSKIHRATVTDCEVDYVGSITLDPVLMGQADLLVNEQVHVWDIDTVLLDEENSDKGARL
jgi:aspartate 1-decarboxylase